ncbi:MAG: hypothetical protein ACREAG_04000 [Nitrosopumilaceae archaeon]
MSLSEKIRKNILSKKDRGRPTSQEQLAIIESIKPYFQMGFSAEFTHTKTGVSRKTIQKYFKKWREVALKFRQKGPNLLP